MSWDRTPSKTVEDYLKKMSEELEKLTQLMKNAQGSTSFLVETPAEYSSRMAQLRNNHIEIRGLKKIMRDILEWLLAKVGG